MVNRATQLRRAAGLLVGLAAVACSASRVGGQQLPTTVPASTQPTGHQISLVMGRNAVINTVEAYKTVSVANPEVADVNTIGPRAVLVVAKKPGKTQVLVWDDADRAESYEVEVSPNLGELREQLKLVIPDSEIQISSANGTLVLRGRVTSLDASKQAGEIAVPYAQKVLNFLEVSGGQQVMLQVRFAEVSRSALSALGVNTGYTDGTSRGGSNVGQVSPFGIVEGQTKSDLLLGVPSPSPNVTLFGNAQIGGTNVWAFISALRQNNMMRTLADPNLVTVSGQEASFLAGGKFPVPVPQVSGGNSTTITVDYQEFGVRLSFTPVVLGNGRVRLKCAPEVSDLDFSNGLTNAGFKIPLINTRQVNTTIELAEGQTFAIAGLLNHNIQASSDVTPVLGDLPVLGTLFRSVRYQKRETELVVLVTPRLVEAMNPDQVPQVPGGEWREPNESDLFLKGDLGGPKAKKEGEAAGAKRVPPMYQGEYGYQPVASTTAER